eukprot:3222299-Pyramimonas_sp.AAC.1
MFMPLRLPLRGAEEEEVLSGSGRRRRRSMLWAVRGRRSRGGQGSRGGPTGAPPASCRRGG